VARIQVDDSTTSEAKGRQIMISSPGTQVSSSLHVLESKLTRNNFRSIVSHRSLPNSSLPSSTSVMTSNNLSENLSLGHSSRTSAATSTVRFDCFLPIPSPNSSELSKLLLPLAQWSFTSTHRHWQVRFRTRATSRNSSRFFLLSNH